MCINADVRNQLFTREDFKYVKEIPKEGEIYTVSKQVLRNGQVGYILNEIDSGIKPNGRPVTWLHSRFILLKPQIEEKAYKAELFSNN